MGAPRAVGDLATASRESGAKWGWLSPSSVPGLLVNQVVGAGGTWVGDQVLVAGVDQGVVLPAEQDQVGYVGGAVVGVPFGAVVGMAPRGRKVAFATVPLP